MMLVLALALGGGLRAPVPAAAGGGVEDGVAGGAVQAVLTEGTGAGAAAGPSAGQPVFLSHGQECLGDLAHSCALAALLQGGEPALPAVLAAHAPPVDMPGRPKTSLHPGDEPPRA